MDLAQVKELATLRTVVGYLGERDQFAWWPSAFFGPGSKAFVTPVFGKTHLLAQCNGVTAAAAVLHDERIGVGQVYHLFRLPEEIEQKIQRTLVEMALTTSLPDPVTSKEPAMAYLQSHSTTAAQRGVGPTRVGNLHDLYQFAVWGAVAVHYHQAFTQSSQVFPYFTERT